MAHSAEMGQTMQSSAVLRRSLIAAAVAALVGAMLVAGPGDAEALPDRSGPVAQYWTAERMANAIPRDLVIDEQGRGYLRHPDGSLEPYGSRGGDARTTTLRAAPGPQAKPETPGGGGKGGGGGGSGTTDTTPPDVTQDDPTSGATIGATHTFKASVTDADSGVKSVTFAIVHPNGSPTSSFSATHVGSDSYEVALEGFTDGDWSWYVVAKDNAKKGGNTTTTPPTDFTVSTGSGDGGGGGGDAGDVVTNAEWTAGGAVQKAAGRIYFEMRTNGPNYGGYVCSGTVATDAATNVSIIITAAHCVYDDANKEFARNVLFIPNQAGTSGTGTNRNCDDDPYGCWAPTHGVVDDDWANRTWPDNIPWDYGYYVVPTSGAHSGAAASNDSLELAVGSLGVQFTVATQGAYTHALGYSYSEDPNFMYCAEGLGTDGGPNRLWLGSCDLSGGASGGPWVQPMNTTTGSGPIIAVNSYGYSTKPGMGAAALTGSAACLLHTAETSVTSETGVIAPCSAD